MSHTPKLTSFAPLYHRQANTAEFWGEVQCFTAFMRTMGAKHQLLQAFETQFVDETYGGAQSYTQGYNQDGAQQYYQY